jgi:predicted GTPase
MIKKIFCKKKFIFYSKTPLLKVIKDSKLRVAIVGRPNVGIFLNNIKEK